MLCPKHPHPCLTFKTDLIILSPPPPHHPPSPARPRRRRPPRGFPQYEIESMGVRYPVTYHARAVFDPDMQRVKGIYQ